MLLNLSRVEADALRALLAASPRSPVLEGVQAKLGGRAGAAEPLPGQMNVFDCIEESRREIGAEMPR